MIYLDRLPDFAKPQEYNVEIGAKEIADETASRTMPLPPVLYDPPPVVGMQADPDLYPRQRHGVLGPRMRRR